MNEFDEEELAEIIDEWYFSWKDTITDDGLPHNFGFAKEDLKSRLAAALPKELRGKEDEGQEN
jgi:hypothetical protein